MVLRLIGAMLLSEPVVQIHSDAGGAEEKNENDQDQQAAVRHSRMSVLGGADSLRRRDNVSPALNAVLGLAVAPAQTQAGGTRRASGRRVWVPASGFQPAGVHR